MSTIRDLLKRRPLLLDGATGTELEKRGINVNDKLWSGLAILTNPEEVYSLHLDYLKSGSDICLTSTYQLSKLALLEKGLNPDEIYGKSIDLAYRAQQDYLKEAGKQTFIVGSIGPFGAYLCDGSEYTGNYRGTEGQELYDFHYDRLKFLFDSPKVDIIGFETIPCFEETKVIVQLINDLNKQSKVKKDYYISFSTNHLLQLVDGTTLHDTIKFLSESTDDHLLATGSNCCALLNSTNIVDKFQIEFNNFSNLKDLKVIIYPNSGEIYDGVSKTWSVDPKLKPKSGDLSLALVEKAQEWVGVANVGFIGGCCRTGPEDIKHLREYIDTL